MFNIDALCKQDEGQTLERKSAFIQQPGNVRPIDHKVLARTISEYVAAFANADGGILLVGVENDGRVTGISYSPNQLKLLCDSAKTYLKPELSVQGQVVQYGAKQILIFDVPPSLIPHKIKGGCPYRIDDQTVWLSEVEVRGIKQAKLASLPVERRLIETATLADLRLDLLEQAKERLGCTAETPIETFLTDVRLAQQYGQTLKLTLAACLLFARDPVQFHSCCGVDFRRFAGTEVKYGAENNEIREKFFEAPLPLLIRRVYDFLETQIAVSKKLYNLFFEERPEYPDFAWQEAIVNAVAHRDYSNMGCNIEVWMFDDRIEVTSPGGLPEAVPLNKLVKRQRVHFSRNPLVMRVLRAFRFVRERGEGIPRMFEVMEASALPPPELHDDGLTFIVTLRNTPVFDEQTMRWLRQFPLEKLNARQRRILAWCYQGQGSFALRDYGRVNEVVTSLAQREIQQMVSQEIVERVGERKAARYYPVAQVGDLLDKLRDFFKRHDSLSNAEFRQLAAISNYKKASAMLRRLAEQGFVRAKGEKRWTRYYPTEQLIQKRI